MTRIIVSTALPCLLFAAIFFAMPAAVAKGEESVFARLFWDATLLRAAREETLYLYLEDRQHLHPELTVELLLPEGLKLLDDATKTVSSTDWKQEKVYIGGKPPRPPVEEPYPTAQVAWHIQSDSSCSGVITVNIAGAGINETCRLTARFTEALEVTKADYVPEPQSVDSDRYVGMIYCPLWKPGDHYGWHMLEKSAPWRKPALGWYDESLPEVTDWEIKWNVEHGVDFIFYCWYRNYGNEGKPVEQMLSHGIHDGLFNARYGDKIKFCIMWTNNDYSGIASIEDLMDNLMSYWMENYFKRSNYLLIDNKPVLAVYDIRRLIKDLGSNEAVKAALDLMREKCKAEGFDGLWILGESRHWWPEYLETMAACGFDASFAYCWNNVPDQASDEEAHDTILSNLQKRKEWNLLPDIPTVSAMWNPNLWEQYVGNKVSTHYHISPEGFERVCRSAKTLTDDLPENSLARRMVLVDDWNEWGEGHYLAPCREHGFEYLDVLRRVFTDAPEAHTDLIPEDVGLGPYDAAYLEWLKTMRINSEK